MTASKPYPGNLKRRHPKRALTSVSNEWPGRHKFPAIKGVYDDGRLARTGDRPADWYRAAMKPGRGSDR